MQGSVAVHVLHRQFALCVVGERQEMYESSYVVLDRKLFWAVKSEEVWAKQDEEEVEAEDAEPVPKKPRSALEKVMAKYGNKEEEPMPKIEVVQKTKSDTGEKTIIGFEDVHVVSEL